MNVKINFNFNIAEILLWLWQFPQHLLAGILYLFNKNKIFKIIKYKTSTVIWLKNVNWGISLGNYIFVSIDYHNQITTKHEYGHSIQSRIFGWLYLIVIGISSGLLNRLTYYRVLKVENYYKFWTEKWADKLGGVETNER